mmetsp:Transcript_7917/g.11647  ORF Transcript_7917/g.11647 Transcript_7917/m.11647 type:complete len:272 (+) Transcript_7917:153-968(+)|eukprot:CAMPEP_0197254512 /NCGR_PEP_ID=MMETSP1429-20130617/68907_1 /TAXON_ID=49237 /ORGANISM="Chaetoceros  sp., Strain UNC1202" /LENGTH=271 /DNA_ID=CAMNT_0042717519 /DNA_START=152 /DNA_END=967 /DNA_ORIENTATION=-
MDDDAVIVEYYYYGEDICKVYDGEDNFTKIVQAFLAVMALASLYIKRNHEVPKRKFMTWWLDVSKQGIGAVYAHCSNMVIAALIVNHTRGEYVLTDQCAWYAISFLVDTTVGLFVSLVLLGWLNDVAKERGWETLMHNGVYEGEYAMKHWRHQVWAWVAILTIVRVVVGLSIWTFSPILSKIGDFAFTPIQNNIRFELLFVMIIFPGVLNFFYFWVADHFLKAGPEHTGAHEDPDPEDGATYYSTDDVGNVVGSPSLEMSKVVGGELRTVV